MKIQTEKIDNVENSIKSYNQTNDTVKLKSESKGQNFNFAKIKPPQIAIDIF